MRTLPGAAAKAWLEVTVATMTVARRLAFKRLARTVSDPVLLGLGRATAARMLDQMLQQLPAAADQRYTALETAANAGAPHALHAGELRLMRQIRHLVIADMAAQLRA